MKMKTIIRHLNQFPVLERHMSEMLGINNGALKITYYDRFNSIISIKENLLENNIVKLGEDTDWLPETGSVELEGLLRINNPGILFGNCGLIDDKGRLGIAIFVKSASSHQRYIENRQIFGKNSEGPVDYSYKFRLDRNRFRGTVILSFVLYVASLGGSGKKSSIISGTILGELKEPIEVVFDGNGSLFPILDKPLGVSGPLWQMDFASTDPNEDPVEPEYIALALNNEHQYYQTLTSLKDEEINPLMIEVLTHWLAQVYEKIRNDFPGSYTYLETERSDDVSQGSITAWLSDLVNAYQINLKDHSTISSSINSKLYSYLGGAE